MAGVDADRLHHHVSSLLDWADAEPSSCPQKGAAMPVAAHLGLTEYGAVREPCGWARLWQGCLATPACLPACLTASPSPHPVCCFFLLGIPASWHLMEWWHHSILTSLALHHLVRLLVTLLQPPPPSSSAHTSWLRCSSAVALDISVHCRRIWVDDI